MHAPSTGGTVRLDYLSSNYWSRAYLQAKRVLPPGHLAQNPDSGGFALERGSPHYSSTAAPGAVPVRMSVP